MNTTFPGFSTPLLFLTILFTTLGSSLYAQEGGAREGDAREDSLRAVSEVQAEQQVLRQELKELRSEFEKVRREAEGTERNQQLEEIERRIVDVETRLDALERSLEPGSFDDWDDEWDEWVDEKSYGSDTDDWFAGADDQFDVDEMFFRKFPSNYPWSFPLTTRLHETLFRYNRVEGLYIGIAQSKRLYWNSKPWIVSTGSLGYGFANHTWRYSLGLYLPLYLEDQIIEIGAEGHSFTDSKDQWAFDRDENTLIALIAREDFLDYFERRGFTATASWYIRGKDDLSLRATLGYAHDTYASMARNTNWSIFGGDKNFRANPGINDGNVNSIVLSAGMNTLASLDVRKHGWDATLQFEKAGDVFAGDFAFSQLLIDLRRYEPLSTHLNLNLRLRGGISDGILPLQRAFELGGPSTLPAYRYKEFSGSSAALLNAEFIIRSTIAGNARGWAKRILTSTNIILFADAGTTNQSTPLSTEDVTHGALPAGFGDTFLDDWKSDVGVAIGSVDGDFRIGAAWRLDRAETPTFILRFTRPF